MKNILIASYDLEVGGVERSLISMLDNFDYKNNKVDLMLYSHTGDFMNLLPTNPNLLKEDKKYKTFRLSIKDTFKSGNINIGIARLIARFKCKSRGTVQMQYIWKYTLPFLPKNKKKYDVAISYLWPHDYVAYKVDADKKIAWIHTDYSVIDTDIDLDIKVWNKFDHIVAVSEDCKKSFLIKYPSLKEKVIVIENITSPNFIKKQSKEEVEDFEDDSDVFKVLSVGRYCDAKGFDNAIKSLKLLYDRGYKNIKWYLIGYGGDEGLLKRLIKENKLEDSFILLGKRTNPYPYMKKCDLYVQPSRYEGKAVTVTEAKILNKPILITNYLTANSQIEDGFDGVICELSVEGIANGIERMINDKKLREAIIHNTSKVDYGNKFELEKLYRVI